MICPNCGMSIRDGSRFCEECGARLDGQADSPSDAFYGYEAGLSRPAPGYSRKLESEAVLAALKKQRKSTRIVGLVVILLPLLAFGVYGTVSDGMELWQALFAGVVISVIMAITVLAVSLHKKLAKPFEGTLTRKQHTRHVHRDNAGFRQSRHDYILYITGTDGKRHKKAYGSDHFQLPERGRPPSLSAPVPDPF